MVVGCWGEGGDGERVWGFFLRSDKKGLILTVVMGVQPCEHDKDQ